MSNVSSEVKRWLLVAHEENDKTALTRAVEMLQGSPDTLSTSSELLTLCCEEAIELGVWPLAELCGEALQSLTAPTYALQARALFCAALLRLHRIPVLLRGDSLVDECCLSISLTVRGLTMLLEEWPHESEVMVNGLSYLWQAAEPLYVRGFYMAVVDVVEFATMLVERLMIGGGYTYVQWVTRYATCLRGTGRHGEAITQLNNALDAAQRLGHERLHVQLLRTLALTTASRDAIGAIANGKAGGTRNDVSLSKAPLQYIINTTQSFLASPHDPVVSSALPDLQNIFDAFSGNAVVDVVGTTAAAAAVSSSSSSGGQTSKGTSSSKPKTARGAGAGAGGGGGAGLLDGLVIASAEVREELLSDVVLCLALCGDTARCQIAIPGLLRSTNLRAQTFGTFANVVLGCRAAGLMTLAGAIDASYLTAPMLQECLRCIRVLEDTLESAKMIPDASECAYTVRVGIAILWVLCLPLLQEESHHQVRHTLARMAKYMTTYAGNATSVPLQVRAEYESAVAELDEDNLSVAIQEIQRALSRRPPADTATTSPGTASDSIAAQATTVGGSTLGGDGAPSLALDFPLLWLLRRAQMRQVSDPSTLDSAEEQALHSLEQSKLVSTASKRLALLKACFNKLPPMQEDSQSPVDAAPGLAGGMGSGQAVSPTPRKVAAAGKRGSTRPKGGSVSAPAQSTLPPRRSLAELYAALLRECCRVESELGPSLIPIAKSTAEALSAMPIAITDPYTGDYLRLKAEAALALATVLRKEKDSFKDAFEKAALRPQLVASLLEAANLSTQLFQLGYGSAWITVNACQLYLNWRASSFASGDFGGAAACAELDTLYDAMWHSGINPNREWALVTDLGLALIAAHASEFFASKGEDFRATPATAGASATSQSSRTAGGSSSRSFDGIMRHILQCPKGEGNNSHLKRALEVCSEVIDKIDLPSRKASHLLLFPALSRLCGGGAVAGKTDVSMVPQAQLLVILGRTHGPMTPEEKRQLLEVSCLELLKADPSVALCGRVALAAHELGEERIVIDVCELAQDLYAHGNLGWGTRFAPASTLGSSVGGGGGGALGSNGAASAGVEQATVTTTTTMLSAAMSPTTTGPTPGMGKKSLMHSSTAAAAQTFAAIYPRPCENDWTWFSRVQLLQAEIYQQRVVGMHAENREKVNLRVLQLCTNAAIAATHGLAADMSTCLCDAVVVYAATIPRLVAADCDAAKLHPSLKMLLSDHILGPLGSQLARTPGPNGASLGSAARDDAVKLREHVTTSVVTIGQCFLRSCAALGVLNESVTVLEQLFGFLPPRFHKVFKVEEVRIRCQLGLPTTAVTRAARNDDPETESSVWVAVAQNSSNDEQSLMAWRSAIGAVAHHPRPKAEVLLALAEYLMLTKADTIAYGDVTTILLSALDNVEGFHASTVGAASTQGGRLHTPSPPPSATAGPSAMHDADAATSILQVCGVTSDTEPVSTALRALVRGGSGGCRSSSSPLNGTDASTALHGDCTGPRTVADVLLALRIAHCLFKIANAYPDDRDSLTSALFKEDVALLVSHYVEVLWRHSVDRVSVAVYGAAADTSTPPVLQLPPLLDDWFGFRAPSTFCDALAAALTKHERELLGSATVVGPLFDVADFFQCCGLDTHSFLLYSWLDLSATAVYTSDDPRGDALRRAACWQAHLCAVRCGAAKLGMMYEVPPASAAHWRAVDDHLRLRPEPSTSSDVGERSQARSARSTRMRARTGGAGAVEVQPAVGSLADLLLREADALASFAHVEEAALIATRVRPWAEQHGDAVLVARCHILQAARQIVNGETRDALSRINALEEQQDVPDSDDDASGNRGGSGGAVGRGILTRLPTADVVRWYVEKATLLVHTGALDGVCRVTAAVEAAAARLAVRGQQSPETLAATLARSASRAVITEYASGVVALLSRQDIDIAAWIASDTPVPVGTLVRRAIEPLLAHLETSTHVLHRAQAALGRAHSLMRADYSVLWTPLSLDSSAFKVVLESLSDEDQAIAQLMDTLQGAASAVASASVARDGCANASSELQLYTKYTLTVSQLSQLRARNDMERLRIAGAILRQYRALSMAELGLPTGGPPELEKHVMQFVRDPVQPTDTSSKDTTLLHMDWSSYAHGEVPEEVKNAFAHFGLAVDTVATASRLRADVFFRAALDTVRSGPSHTGSLERLCTLELQRAFEQSLQASDEQGVDLAVALERAVHETWQRLPQYQMAEKVTRHTKGTERAKKGIRSGSSSSLAMPVRPMSDGELQLASQLRELLFQYQYEFAFERLHNVAVLFANACAFWQRPHEAAVSVEVAQSAQLCEVLFAGCRAHFGSTTEAKLWRKYDYARLRLMPFSTSAPFAHLRRDLIQNSPILSQMSAVCCSAGADTSAGGLATSDAAGTGRGITSGARGSTAAEQASYARLGHTTGDRAHITSASSLNSMSQLFTRPLSDPAVDGAVLSIAAAKQSDTFLLSLRASDGAVYVRRVSVKQADLAAMANELATLDEVNVRAVLSGSDTDREAAAASTTQFLSVVTERLLPLWSGFEDALVSASGRQPFFLCLCPALAPLPLEHLQPFSGLYAVQRELGIHVIQAKQANKVSRASAVGGGLLAVIDPYGDHPASLQSVCPSDAKGKYSDVLTATNGVRSFSDAFLLFKLQSYNTISSLVVDMCGSAATVLTPTVLSNVRLEHLNAAVIMDRGVTDASLRRDQRHALGSTHATRHLSANWITPMLLLARGVRSVAVSTFPIAPADLDAVAKRGAAALAAGRSAFDACTALPSKFKHDGRLREYTTLYGVSTLSTKAK